MFNVDLLPIRIVMAISYVTLLMFWLFLFFTDGHSFSLFPLLTFYGGFFLRDTFKDTP